jgi:osmotically-inducible protein OsmY
MGDHDLRTAVERELDWDPSINATGIGVAVNDGVVTLSGHVASYPEKREAERIAARVREVRAVAGELDVRLPELRQRTDEDIARAAAETLAWNTLVPHDKIKIWVDNGRVTLEGIVDWQYQRAAADAAIRVLTGVTDVNNHIFVTPAVNRELVSTEIESALLRNAAVDAQRIRVETAGDRVMLSGKVASAAEREEAENAAWGCPGVCRVENYITVDPLVAMIAR